MKIKLLTGLGLAISILVSSVAPAMAGSMSPIDQAKDKIETLRASQKCFSVKDGAVIVPYNLTSEQKDFLTRARFESQVAYQNYILINSVNNTMAQCLKTNWIVPGFTRTRVSKFVFQFDSKFTKVILVNGKDRQEIQGSLKVSVDLTNRKAPVIGTTRGA
jgi:hypothetical protein